MNKSTIECIKRSGELANPVEIEGGKELIERLKTLFGCYNQTSLAELLNISPATLSIWATRNSTPHELLIRLSIRLNISLEVLCFGEHQEIVELRQKVLSLKKQDIKVPLDADGGRTLIERLLHLFKVRTRIELGDLLGITAGTFSTWTTRNTVPYELIARIHLNTGVSLSYLCFGKGEEYPANAPRRKKTIQQITAMFKRDAEPETKALDESINVYNIENGQLVPQTHYEFNFEAAQAFGLSPDHEALVLQHANKLLFVSTAEKTVTEGTYLYRINDVYKIGAMKLLPDGKVYLLDNGERYEVNSEATHIHGKVVSVLERC